MEKLINYSRAYLPGILLATITGMAGRYLARWIPNLGGVTLAIILGLLIGNIFKLHNKFEAGLTISKKSLLTIAIMLMGLKLEIGVLGDLGLSAIFIVFILVISAITSGYIFGKLTGLSTPFSLLLGIGNGICGSSAIAATAPFLSQDEEEIGLSIGVVNLLGTIGIFLLPLLTYALQYTEANSGIMIGGSLQAVGQVVAAGFSINDNVGNLATVVKMGRILMLGPVVLALSLFNGNSKENKKTKVAVPPFIIGFFIFSLVGSFGLLPEIITGYLKDFSKILLTIAMAAIGIKIKISSLLNQGPRALLTGVFIFAGQLLLITLLIKLLL